MKNRFKYIAIFGLAVTMVSCTSNPQENVVADQEKTEIDKRTTRGMAALDIKLNDGRPWEVSPEIERNIKKMQRVLQEVDGVDYSPELYKAIGDELMKQFEYTLREFKIEGEAQNQFYNYMQPMKLYFEELNSSDKEVAQLAVRKFNQHLALFPKYFRV